MAIDQTASFVQYQVPRLRAGEYRITAQLVAGPNGQTTTFDPVDRGFAVTAPRFQLPGGALDSLFPPNLADGELAGVLPHAVLAPPALPWTRTASSPVGPAVPESTPWLAVLTVQAGELAPVPGTSSPIVDATIASLVPTGTSIEVAGAAPLVPAVVGTLPPGTVSYPGLALLDVGEAPADPVRIVDVPVDLFTRIAPTSDDLDLLAHVRAIDTQDSANHTDTVLARAVVLGNRMGSVDQESLAMLVSFEQLSNCLPDAAGNAGPGVTGATAIRLVVLASWTFTARDGDQHLASLLRGVDADGIGSVHLPAAAAAPDAVDAAIEDAATGLSADDAATLVANARGAGYVALDHHLRQAGRTVSWYRGPLLPYMPAGPTAFSSVLRPDALLRYDPQTGMFDASYAAAWQLGQLLALAAGSYSVALYRWKQGRTRAEAVAAELALLDAALVPADDPQVEGDGPFATLLARRRLAADSVPDPPQVVLDFLRALRRLEGVPFGYLVPDEAMLPPESLRAFAIDQTWMDALVDGAFSVGRTTDQDVVGDEARLPALLSATAEASGARRANRPITAEDGPEGQDGEPEVVTGLLLRSEAVRGWPRLRVDAWSTPDTTTEPDLASVRVQRLSPDVLLCLFDGTVAAVAIREPSEQLHCGVELSTAGGATTATTTLRALDGDHPGGLYPQGAPPATGTAAVPLRTDALTVQARLAAASIADALRTQFGVTAGQLGAHQFAVELMKGGVRVEYQVTGGRHG